jgi:hypothetical protein
VVIEQSDVMAIVGATAFGETAPAGSMEWEEAQAA